MTLDVLSRVARPGSPLYRIMQRRVSASPASHALAGDPRPPSAATSVLRMARAGIPRTDTGVGSYRGGGSTMGVQRGDFQGGGYPTGGGPHFSPGLNLSPGLRFGTALSTTNGYPNTYPSIPGMIASATRLRGTGLRPTDRADAVGMRGPW